MEKKIINWRKYSKRMCQTMHHCRICDKQIALGAVYYDGGYGRRAHEVCVEPKEPDMKETIVAIMKKCQQVFEWNFREYQAVSESDYGAVATKITTLFKYHIQLTRDQLQDLETLTAGTSDENFQRLNQVFSDALGEKKQPHKY